jgi:mlo protein
MTLGFISLLLTVTGRYVSRICIPEGAANTMLPCVQSGHSEAKEPEGHGRRHLSEDPTDLFSCPKVSERAQGAVVVYFLRWQDLLSVPRMSG